MTSIEANMDDQQTMQGGSNCVEPRQFSEKIARLARKEGQQKAEFERLMSEIKTITQNKGLTPQHLARNRPEPPPEEERPTVVSNCVTTNQNASHHVTTERSVTTNENASHHVTTERTIQTPPRVHEIPSESPFQSILSLPPPIMYRSRAEGRYRIEESSDKDGATVYQIDCAALPPPTLTPGIGSGIPVTQYSPAQPPPPQLVEGQVVTPLPPLRCFRPGSGSIVSGQAGNQRFHPYWPQSGTRLPAPTTALPPICFFQPSTPVAMAYGSLPQIAPSATTTPMHVPEDGSSTNRGTCGSCCSESRQKNVEVELQEVPTRKPSTGRSPSTPTAAEELPLPVYSGCDDNQDDSPSSPSTKKRKVESVCPEQGQPQGGLPNIGTFLPQYQIPYMVPNHGNGQCTCSNGQQVMCFLVG